ncbi:MAG TPA: DUF2066 domain-containing protein [Alphaproteobacteria bacterium]|nr:DUF2066 domain-containing protein [Alphaproteobacteria bacterium]
MALAIMLVTIALPGIAAADQAYTVRDIRAAKTAPTGIAARQDAMREARDQALAHLLRRLVPSSHHRSLPVLPASRVADLVVSTDIEEEQVLPTAYRGRFAITFDSAGVRQVLEARGLPYSDEVSPPIVIIPVFERAGALQLWERPNPWDTAWRQRVGAQGLLTTVMAEGKPSEQLVVSADQALEGNEERLQALAQSYGARGAAVAFAKFRVDPRTGQPVIEASLTGYGVAPQGPFSQTFQGSAGMEGGPDEAAAELAETAAAELSEQMAEAWKRQNLTVPTASPAAESGPEILASTPLTHLGAYASMLRQLREVPAVERFSLAKLTSREAVFRLWLRGGPSQAQRILSQYGITLTQGPDGWTLRNGG